MADPPPLPALEDDATSVARWRRALFAPPRRLLERALAVPELRTAPPPGLSPGAWRAWRAERAHELAREYWENLVTAGLVPERWLDDPRRRFAGERATHDARRGHTSTSFERELFAQPPTPEHALALASDMDNALAVDALAREALRRALAVLPDDETAPNPRDEIVWPDPHDATLVWDLAASPRAHTLGYGLWPEALGDALARTFATRDERFGGDLTELADDSALEVPLDELGFYEHAVRCERLEALYDQACALDLPLPPRHALRAASPPANTYRALGPNPYTPRREVLARGYALTNLEWQSNTLRILGVLA